MKFFYDDVVAESYRTDGSGDACQTLGDGVHHLPEVLCRGVADELVVVEGKELPNCGDDAVGETGLELNDHMFGACVHVLSSGL